MKIGSIIKNRDGRPRRVDVHGTPYVFAPVEDREGRTHYVADVKNQDHAGVLIGSGSFYAYSDEAPVPALKRGQGDPAPPPAAGNDPKSDTDAQTTVAYAPEIMDEAGKLLQGTVTTISTDVARVSSPDVIRAALALESAQAQPRKTVVALLTSTLDGIAAAGVETK